MFAPLHLATASYCWYCLLLLLTCCDSKVLLLLREMLHQPAAVAYLLLLHTGAVHAVGVRYKVLFLQFGFAANSNFRLLQTLVLQFGAAVNCCFCCASVLLHALVVQRGTATAVIAAVPCSS